MTATTVRLSYAPTNDRIADALDAESYRSYLRRAHRGSIDTGAVWSEFVGRSCGVTGDVVLRVEAVTGGSSIGAETTFVFEPRADGEAIRPPS